jgi:hypothetical protein
MSLKGWSNHMKVWERVFHAEKAVQNPKVGTPLRDFKDQQESHGARHWRLTPVILATLVLKSEESQFKASLENK